jgi:exodeoxyribonuclease X
MTIRVIDVETTGIDPYKDVIIEIASIDVTRDLTVINHRSTLVRPGVPIPPESSAVHHLIEEDLTNAPALEEVIEQFRGADAYVAHNCGFEQAFLWEHFGDPTWICTYKCALRVWPDLVSHSNQVLRYHLGLVNPFGVDRRTLAPHRALSDVIVTAAIFVELLKRVQADQMRWSDLVRWSWEPPLHTVLTFGKHRGQRFDAVPEDYLRWIVEGPNELREEIKFSARYWLEARGIPSACVQGELL